MKIDVGMYVRHNYFGIGKINKEYFDSNNKHWFNVKFNCYKDDECHCGVCEQSVGFKVSNSLINLIEVGDYVNGHEIIEKINDTIYFESSDYIDGKTFILNSDIKSIVTKEQFEAMSYKVEE